jgi:hypothetical protein
MISAAVSSRGCSRASAGEQARTCLRGSAAKIKQSSRNPVLEGPRSHATFAPTFGGLETGGSCAMLDIAAVGAALTRAQQDEALNDLAFFLDEFGSTRAVRVKLQDQESDIKRFKVQVRQLASDGSGACHTNEEVEEDANRQESATTCSATEDADETMAHLDFFLRTYGSTRAVREKLASQKREIVGMQRTIQWLQERRSRAGRREGSSDEPASALTLEMRDEKQDIDTNSTGDTIDADDGGGNEDADILDATMAGDDCEMAAVEEERETRVPVARPPDNLGDRDKEVEKVDTVPREASGVVAALSSHEVERHVVEVSDDRRLRPTDAAKPTESADAVVPDRTAVETSAGGIKRPAVAMLSAAPTIRGKIQKLCGFRGCEKWSWAHGLCCIHDGYRTCSVESCDLIAAAWGLCLQHGGVTRCSSDGCDKNTVSGGHGHCVRHARAQGFLLQGKCKVDGCSCFRASDYYRDTAYERRPVATAKKAKAPVRDHGKLTCKERGCKAKGIVGGDRKGYCFQHGGGYRCQADGCTKARRGCGFCLAHGLNLKSGCKAEGCRKHVVEEGYCLRHYLEREAAGKAPSQRLRQA